MELISSYRKKGREEDKLGGKKDSIFTFLNVRFGSSTVLLQENIHSINDSELLDQVLEKVFSAKTLEDALKVVGKAADK